MTDADFAKELVIAETRKKIIDLELEIVKKRGEIQLAETKLAEEKAGKLEFSNLVKYFASGLVAIGATATVIVTVSSYVKSVSDTHTTRYYDLVNRLTNFGEVTPQNADRAVAMLSQLDSEFLRPPSMLSSFLFPVDDDRAFQVAYIVQPFAQTYGEGLDKVGIMAGRLMGEAVSKINDPVHRDLLVSDSGDHIDSISDKFTTSRFLAAEYLAVMLDLNCQIAFLSRRVGRPGVSAENYSSCQKRLASKDPLDIGNQ